MNPFCLSAGQPRCLQQHVAQHHVIPAKNPLFNSFYVVRERVLNSPTWRTACLVLINALDWCVAVHVLLARWVCREDTVTHTHTRARTHTHTRTHANTHVYTRTHTHVRTHPRTHTHTQRRQKMKQLYCSCLNLPTQKTKTEVSLTERATATHSPSSAKRQQANQPQNTEKRTVVS